MIKTLYYLYGDSHYKDKAATQPSYLYWYNADPNTWKYGFYIGTFFLYTIYVSVISLTSNSNLVGHFEWRHLINRKFTSSLIATETNFQGSINSLARGKRDDLKRVIFEHVLWIKFMCTSSEIAHNDAKWHIWCLDNIGSGNGLVPSGNKSLPESRFTQISSHGFASPQYVDSHKQIHYSDVIMGAIASRITSLTIVYSDAEQRKHQSSASLAFVRGIHRTGEFPAQMASNAENVSIWWRHQVNCPAESLTLPGAKASACTMTTNSESRIYRFIEHVA